LLVIPGVLLSIAWSVSPAVAALEDSNFIRSFGRSSQLTRGHGWPLLVIILLYGVISLIVSFVERAVLGVPLLAKLTTLPPLLVYVLQPASYAVLKTVFAAILAAAYFELREAKEGLAANALAANFD
jgi:hypothetical protein